MSSSMSYVLSDGSYANILYINGGRCRVTYNSIGKQLLLPMGIDISLNLINRLYSLLRQ